MLFKRKQCFLQRVRFLLFIQAATELERANTKRFNVLKVQLLSFNYFSFQFLSVMRDNGSGNVRSPCEISELVQRYMLSRIKTEI